MDRQLDRIDARVTAWMARYGILLLRLALGLVFLWFGAIKFVPGWSPAAELAARTIETLTAGAVSGAAGLQILALWESLIGIGLLLGRFLRLTLAMLFVQMPGTMLPLVMFPEATFVHVPYAPTIEGQYIIKNLVLVSAAIVVGATVRGGRLVNSPKAGSR